MRRSQTTAVSDLFFPEVPANVEHQSDREHSSGNERVRVCRPDWERSHDSRRNRAARRLSRNDPGEHRPHHRRTGSDECDPSCGGGHSSNTIPSPSVLPSRAGVCGSPASGSPGDESYPSMTRDHLAWSHRACRITATANYWAGRTWATGRSRTTGPATAAPPSPTGDGQRGGGNVVGGKVTRGAGAGAGAGAGQRSARQRGGGNVTASGGTWP